MKKLSIILSLILFLTAVSNSYAVDLGKYLQKATPATASHSGIGDNLRTVTNDTQRIANLKKRADFEIQRRIDALNNLISRLSDMKRLSPTQASSLQTQVQSTIESLNTLKTKIDADTDLPTLQADVKSIITGYYIFAFYIEDINLNATLGRLSTTIDNMTTISNKLQTRIQNAQAQNKDVTQLNSWLSDLQAKLADAKTQVGSAQTEIASLSSQGFPGNKSTLLDARTKLKAALQDLKTAYSDAKQIIEQLKTIGNTEPSVSPSESPTVSPTP